MKASILTRLDRLADRCLQRCRSLHPPRRRRGRDPARQRPRHRSGDQRPLPLHPDGPARRGRAGGAELLGLGPCARLQLGHPGPAGQVRLVDLAPQPESVRGHTHHPDRPRPRASEHVPSDSRGRQSRHGERPFYRHVGCRNPVGCAGGKRRCTARQSTGQRRPCRCGTVGGQADEPVARQRQTPARTR